MRTGDMRPSSNVEDARGGGGGFGGTGGSRIAIPIGGRGLGVGGVIFILLFVIFGGNPLALLTGGSGRPSATTSGAASGWQSAEKEVVTRVLGDTEDVWTALFREQQLRYNAPKLVLFTEGIESGCGYATSAVGPFYCPQDAQIYLDLSFYRDLAGRYRAPGDFPQAYVIAHEVGHHIQHQLGLVKRGETDNEYSVRLELQADYLAGVWAHYASKRGLLEAGDIEEGLAAAAAIGDDRLQRQASGRVVPDSFTHGTSAQRVRWFRKGFESGDPRVTNGGPGDTFAVEDP